MLTLTEHGGFRKRAAAKARDPVHHEVIAKAIASYEKAFEQTRAAQFTNWQQARDLAAGIKDEVLARLPEYLEQFERNATAQGARVLWAEDADQARRHVVDIAREHGARLAVKSKSMATEEIDLNETLQRRGIEVLESDLGELIVQLAGEKPYHIVTPAMHRTKAEIAALFHEKLGVDLDADPQGLTMAARRHLRQAFTQADVGITGANFLLAEEGAVVMVENEGNGRLTMACPRVHVVVAGIEKILPRLSDLALFLPLLATSGTAQAMTCYASIVRGPRQPDEADGPQRMVIILLDNGRSRLLSSPLFRQSLRCIRCGACLNACPVFRTIGGHAYHTTYPGPIGSVITPHLRGMGRWRHLADASSLCGACTDVCPVRIDLHQLLLANRREAVRGGKAGWFWPAAMKLWAWAMRDRGRLARLRDWGILFERLGRGALPAAKRRRVPRLSRKTFAQLWEKNEQSR
ncbi:MAG: LutB/LldF family L-lactate oxidation iron-sulfur protein [bacterium]|nr:LutB/LldF family L-lactate oxidation iron-sulfur protein [bacterium]